MIEKSENLELLNEEIIHKILFIRGFKVMIDRDLAFLYEIETKRLNEAVKRNIKRFPADFMFQISSEEKEWIIKHYPHLRPLKFSAQLPYVFTEHGAVMLASILNTEKAIEVNVQIVRVFNKMRELIFANKDIFIKLEQIEKQLLKTDRRLELNDHDIENIFDAINQLITKEDEMNQEPKPKIGFKLDSDKTG
jgi:phage regulator Rha-like protein